MKSRAKWPSNVASFPYFDALRSSEKQDAPLLALCFVDSARRRPKIVASLKNLRADPQAAFDSVNFFAARMIMSRKFRSRLEAAHRRAASASVREERREAHALSVGERLPLAVGAADAHQI